MAFAVRSERFLLDSENDDREPKHRFGLRTAAHGVGQAKSGEHA